MLANLLAIIITLAILFVLFLVFVYGPLWAKALAVMMIAFVLVIVYSACRVSSNISRTEEHQGRRGDEVLHYD